MRANNKISAKQVESLVNIIKFECVDNPECHKPSPKNIEDEKKREQQMLEQQQLEKIIKFVHDTSGYSTLKTFVDPNATAVEVYLAMAEIYTPGPDVKIKKEKPKTPISNGGNVARKETEKVVGSAYDHVYTSTKPLDDVFPELKGVNPHYIEGAGPGMNTNCVSCANATDARLRIDNNNPTATATPSKGYGSELDLAESAPWGFDRNLNLNQVNELMLKAGDGQSRVLIINQGGNVKHVINAVNKNGQIYFIDSQIGKIVELNPNLVYELGRK